MNDDIIAFFAQHGPLTVADAIERGLGAICNSCFRHAVQSRLNRLVASGELSRHTERRSRTGCVGGYTGSIKVFLYKVKS